MRVTELPVDTLQKLQQIPYRSVVAVDLTNATWTTATLGIIVKGPTMENNQHNLSTCIADARWAKGSVSVGLAQAVQPEIYSITNAPKSPFISETSYRAYDMFRIDSGSLDSWRRIRITMDWFNAVNLKLDGSINAPSNMSKTDNHTLNSVDSADETTISILAYFTGSIQLVFITTVEHTLASIFADAISRAGSWRVIIVSLPVQRKQFNPISFHMRKPSYQPELLLDRQAYQNPSTMSSSPFTEFHVRQEITGYAFRVSATTDILALGVIFLHLTMALAHMLLIIRRRSSSCWDSVPELISLAQQSSPSKVALENTTTGIERMSTFQKRARIRVSGSDSQHVELVFDEDHGSQDLLNRPSTNRVYG